MSAETSGKATVGFLSSLFEDWGPLITILSRGEQGSRPAGDTGSRSVEFRSVVLFLRDLAIPKKPVLKFKVSSLDKGKIEIHSVSHTLGGIDKSKLLDPQQTLSITFAGQVQVDGASARDVLREWFKKSVESVSKIEVLDEDGSVVMTIEDVQMERVVTKDLLLNEGQP